MRILLILFILIINLTGTEAQLITKAKVLNNIKCEKFHHVYYYKIDEYNYFAKWKFDAYKTVIYKYSEDFEHLLDTVDISHPGKTPEDVKLFKKNNNIYLLFAFDNSIEVFNVSNKIHISDENIVFKNIIDDFSLYRYYKNSNHNIIVYLRESQDIPNDTIIPSLHFYNIIDESKKRSIFLDREYGVRGRRRRVTENNFNNIIFKAQSQYYRDYSIKAEIYNKELKLLDEYEYQINGYFASYHFLAKDNYFYNIGFHREKKERGRDIFSLAVHSYNKQTKNIYKNFITEDTVTRSVTLRSAKTNIFSENGNLLIGGVSGHYEKELANFDYNSFNNFIVKVNPKCEVIWKYEFGTDHTYDFINHIEKLDGQNYLIVTKEDDHVKLYWMRDLDVGVRESQNKSVSVYPNPASSYLRLQSQEKIREAKIIDVSGNTVMKPDKAALRKLRTGGEVELDIENLNAGTYFLVLDDNQIRKFIVEE